MLIGLLLIGGLAFVIYKFLNKKNNPVKIEVPNSIRRRSLGVKEQFYILLQEKIQSFKVFHINFLEGPFTPEIVQNAILCLQSKHPSLRLGLGPRFDNWLYSDLHFYEYSNANDLINFTVVNRKSNEDWREVFSKKINSDSQSCFGENKLLWEVIFLYDEGGDKHEIIWGICHSIDDGISKVNLTKDFIYYCHEQCTPSSVESLPLHKSLEEISFTPKNIKFLSWTQYFIPQMPRMIWKYLIFPPKYEFLLDMEKIATKEEKQEGFTIISLTEQETKDFVQKCRDHKTTFTAAIAAAAIKSIQELRDVPDGFKYGVTFAVDLRRYLEPEVSKDQVGMFTMWIDTFGTMQKNQSFWDLSSIYREKLHQSTFQESIQNLWDFKGVVGALKGLVTKIAEDPKTQGRNKGLALSSYGNFNFPTNLGKFSLSGLHVVQSTRNFRNILSINCVTINNRAYFTLHYLIPIVSDKTAKKFTSLFENQIKSC